LAAATVASCIVANVDPRVNGIAVDGAEGVDDIGERARDAGAGAVPGAPMPVDEGTLMGVRNTPQPPTNGNMRQVAWKLMASPLQIYVPPAMRVALDRVANERGHTLSAVVVAALDAYLQQLDATYKTVRLP
jgi:hypothetical protein